MDQKQESSTWHDNMLQLNRALALHSTQIESEVGALVSSNAALTKKSESTQKKIKEMETILMIKNQLLTKQQQINELLKNEALQLDAVMALKKSQLHLLKSVKERQMQEREKARRTAADIYRAWEKMMTELADIYEYAPGAKVRTELQRHVEVQKELLASLTADIRAEKQRQRGQRQLALHEEQQRLVKLAHLLLEYRRLNDTAGQVARSMHVLREMQREQEELLKSAPKTDNIFSDDVKEIDTLMQADYLKLSPLKSIHVDFNSDGDEDQLINDEVDELALPMKRPPQSPLPMIAKRFCAEVVQESSHEYNVVAAVNVPQVKETGNNNLDGVRKPSPVKIMNTCLQTATSKEVTDDRAALIVPVRSVVAVDAPPANEGGAKAMHPIAASASEPNAVAERKRPSETQATVTKVLQLQASKVRSAFLSFSGAAAGGHFADTESMFFQSGSREATKPPPPPPEVANNSLEELSAGADARAQFANEEGMLRSSSNHSFSSTSPVLEDSLAEARAADGLDMFGGRDAPHPFTITFGEPKLSSQPRFNIF